MRIAHASDTHQNGSYVRKVKDLDIDLLLITGDCMGNRGRMQLGWGGSGRIMAHLEVKYQESWYRKAAKKWAGDLGSIPVLAVRGNHDFIPYSKWLKHYGATVYEITDDNPMVEILGHRFAGFRQVPWIDGEWSGETQMADLQPLVERAFDADPDILVTHAPPAGILDDEGYGVSPLTSALFYRDREHRITHHFFGHAHGNGGKVEVHPYGDRTITFINGACGLRIHEVL